MIVIHVAACGTSQIYFARPHSEMVANDLGEKVVGQSRNRGSPIS